MAEGTTPKKTAAKKPAAPKSTAKKPATKSAGAAAKPVAKKAAPLKTAATRAAPRANAKPSPLKEKASAATETVKKEAKALKQQAAKRAHEVATQGKDRTTDALDNVAKLIGDAAATVDARVGAQYGDYTRKAAEAVESFATTLKGKDVDDLVKDAGEFVRKSPAVAIGAAAAVGFVLARLIKAGSDDKA